ncbi:MAG: formate dehydrogenase accessory sulfurtransferase FdhD [Dehalococcoidia bacterium]|nr:formate dehydrogenase accessory sulfurtransferase FdhD [Dehalococcoidia bacterium]MCC6267963.1 formate dehydrogenase accessory sulfurtransferase FdhD [Dehalococcoidia bacterium]
MNRYASQLDHDIHRFHDGSWQRVSDQLAIEEPLEIRISHVEGGRRKKTPLSITMRTPGQDFALAAGFLFGEGLVSRRDDIEEIDYCRDVPSDAERCNTVLVTLRPGLEVNLENQKRNFTTTSACGVCGKASLAALAMDGCQALPVSTKISAATVMGLPEALRAAQRGFDSTGGVHAAGLFTPGGDLLALGEDVGRHNAFDKLVGERFLAGEAPAFERTAILLSGRASYELLQKAVRARIPIVASVGAPSSLAVHIAQAFSITLAGFLKPGGFNVYSGRSRIRD